MRFLLLSLFLVIGFTSTAQVDALFRMKNRTDKRVMLTGKVSDNVKYFYTTESGVIPIKRINVACFTEEPPTNISRALTSRKVQYRISKVPLDNMIIIPASTEFDRYTTDIEHNVYRFGEERMIGKILQLVGTGIVTWGALENQDSLIAIGTASSLVGFSFDILAGRHIFRKRD